MGIDMQKAQKETKQRVLDAACVVFAEKGYRDATVLEICTAADANVAAVNYYFGSKEKLYLKVWQSVADCVRDKYFGAIAEERDPTARLKVIITQRVRHAFDDGPAGNLRKMAHSEMGNPTAVHDEVFQRFLLPSLQLLAETISKILGIDPSDALVQRCAFGIHSQLVFLNVLRLKEKTIQVEAIAGTTTPDEAQLQDLADHLIAFVTGGMEAARLAKEEGI
jgi:AcrR family transcriptional regulator